jgi:hypothetical protein
MKKDFILKAKTILQQAGPEFDCYHEATLSGGPQQELCAELYYAKNDQYMTFTYTPEIAPCLDVLKDGSLCVEKDIINSYPKDKGLVHIAAQAYVGIKTKHGLCALLSPKPLSSSEKILKLLKDQ